MHQIAPFQKNFSGGGGVGYAPEPPSKAHGFATCKFPNPKQKFLASLPNPGYAPDK